MPPTIPPADLRHLARMTSGPSNQLAQLVSRQGLEARQGPPGLSGVGPAGPEGQSGPWAAVESVPASLEESVAVECRSEGGATVGRLMGVLTVLETYTVGEALFTLPAAVHPSKRQHITTSAVTAGAAATLSAHLVVEPSGEVIVVGMTAGTTLAATSEIFIAGTFPLT